MSEYSAPSQNSASTKYFHMRNKNTSYYLAVILIVLALANACSKKAEPQNTSNVMKFSVDTLLLDEQVKSAELALQFRAPKGWKPLESALQKELEAKMSAVDSAEIRILTKYVFKRSQGTSALAVSTLVFPSLDTTFTQKMVHYTTRINSSVDTSSMKVARFTKGNIPMTQFVFRSPQSVAFKLLFPSNNQILQFDYIIATSEFNNEIRAVESSIGSILLSQ
jgi:hypothetical protein